MEKRTGIKLLARILEGPEGVKKAVNCLFFAGKMRFHALGSTGIHWPKPPYRK